MPRRAARLLFAGLLGLIAALAALATVAIIAIGTFSSTTLQEGEDRKGPWQSEPYVWDGGEIMLAPTSSRRYPNPNCVITPEQGEVREIQLLSRSARVGDAYVSPRYWNHVELRPWFEGSATIVCSGPVRVWSGFGYSVERINTDRFFPWAAAGAIALPLIGAVLLWRGRRSKVG